jgi:hypothetical protein
MIWILFFVFLTVSALACVVRSDFECAMGLGVFAGIMGSVAGIIAYSSLDTYPKLLGLQAEALIYSNSTELVKEAYYKEKEAPYAVVSGSLTNTQQSKNLSDFIISVTVKKAAFNKKLVETQALKKLWLYWLFGNSAMWDSQIDNMKPLD